MKRQTFIKLLLTAIIIAGCGNAKNTNADVASSKEEMQQAEETGDDALKLTTLKLTDKEWLAVKSSYDKLANARDEMYERYNGQDGYGHLDKYGIGIVDCFWDAFFYDHELLKDIEAEDCYNLPNLAKLIRKMKQDERLVNKQTGTLEPWSWSPEGSVTDIND